MNDLKSLLAADLAAANERIKVLEAIEIEISDAPTNGEVVTRVIATSEINKLRADLAAAQSELERVRAENARYKIALTTIRDNPSSHSIKRICKEALQEQTK